MGDCLGMDSNYGGVQRTLLRKDYHRRLRQWHFSCEQMKEEKGAMDGIGEECSDLCKGIEAESILQAQRIGRRSL